jgi:hypothetical protein
MSVKGGSTLSQRSIELLIGRLITDEAFRNAFVHDFDAALQGFMDAGHELTAVEIQALQASGRFFWDLADRIDPRLQKVMLK